MKQVHVRVLGVFFSLVAMAGVATAAGDLWLHVKVDEGDGAKVTVNLPVSIIEKALPMLPVHELHGARLSMEHADVELESIRELWQEVRTSPDMTFVTVEDGSENVRVWKKSDWVYVEVRDEDGPESVDVKIPMAVVDALLAGDEIDIESAVRALIDHGAGEFVTVSDRDDNVRVWVDETPEAE